MFSLRHFLWVVPLILVALIVAFSSPTFAAPSWTINYQGRLKQGGSFVGDPTPTTQDLIFKICSRNSADTCSGYLINKNNVPINVGVFNVSLDVDPSNSIINYFNSSPYYLGVSADGGSTWMTVEGTSDLPLLTSSAMTVTSSYLSGGSSSNANVLGNLYLSTSGSWGNYYSGSGALIRSDGWTSATAPWDAGIYSNKDSWWVRFVNKNAGFAWYSDGDTGTNAIMSLGSGGHLTVKGETVDNAWLNISGKWDTANPNSVSQQVSINGNQIWKSVTTQDPTLYLQWSNPGGNVAIGGQSGATNSLFTYGSGYFRDNLGIGKTNPGYRLEAMGEIANTEDSASYAVTRLKTWGLTSAGTMYLEPGSSGNLYVVPNDWSQKLNTFLYGGLNIGQAAGEYAGSNTDASVKFFSKGANGGVPNLIHPAGRIYADAEGGWGGQKLVLQAANNWSTYVNDQFVLRGNGNVGIGRSNPTQKLDVNGKIKATDFNLYYELSCQNAGGTWWTTPAVKLGDWTARCQGADVTGVQIRLFVGD